ncbi:Uncharacterised protein [Vibrio cholerae]|nr:Uncharacterised protein [Vibrio cholerae]
MSARNTWGACQIAWAPSKASTKNHSNITGAKKRPIRSVPIACTANSATIIIMAMGST